MKYLSNPIEKYLDDLSARMSAPGGGSAAALSLAMACSLLAMACEFSLGKVECRKYRKQLARILARSRKMGEICADLLDQDILAYRQKDLTAAVKIPARLCALSVQVAQDASVVALRGNRALVTDVVLAVFFAESAAKAALFYVKVNLKRKKPQKAKERILVKKLGFFCSRVSRIRKKMEASVGDSLRR